MPTEGIGVYALGVAADENNEISSTYEGRHLTFLASDITSHDPAHTLQQKGHPCVISECIVGVAFTTEVLGADLIAIDTEGIWYLTVDATVGNGAVTHGDQLYINKATAVISNDDNKNTNAHFGYALGGVAEGVTAVIAVKVHWDPDDAEEKVGVTGTPYESGVSGIKFREYYYEAIGGGSPVGEDFRLTISEAICSVAVAKFIQLNIPGDAKNPGGYSAVMELELNIGAGDASVSALGVLALNFNNQNTYPVGNYTGAYIMLNDYSSANHMEMLLAFMQIAVLPDGSFERVLTDSADLQPNSDVRIKCGYGATGIPFWIMCTTTAPTA